MLFETNSPKKTFHFRISGNKSLLAVLGCKMNPERKITARLIPRQNGDRSFDLKFWQQTGVETHSRQVKVISN